MRKNMTEGGVDGIASFPFMWQVSVPRIDNSAGGDLDEPPAKSCRADPN
jgi:hypothetical protein